MRNPFACVLMLLAGLAIGIIGSVLFIGEALPAFTASTVTTNVPTQQKANTTLIDGSSSIETSTVQDLSSNRALLEFAEKVTESIKEKNFQTLSTYIHPTKGVTFTPYSTVDLKANLNFKADKIKNAADDKNKYSWGLTDGKGEPIQLTISDYFDQYVYNADYLEASVIGIDQVIASGNSPENVSEEYPDARFVEFHYPSLDPANNGFDWCSLKLVFEAYNGEYKLVGIIHSQWTI
ncbi:hypothetical protein SDC9_142683 [bioreactor metagenome]|uniref:Uncharacterized protein n=1 Tax=bioreactor metagenome TaxID=1076179 RepID=A0A645E2B2_9ZZZZ